MVVFLLQKKASWMEGVSKSVSDQWDWKMKEKFSRRLKPGDFIEVRESYKSKQPDLYMLTIPDMFIFAAQEYVRKFQRNVSLLPVYDHTRQELEVLINNDTDHPDAIIKGQELSRPDVKSIEASTGNSARLKFTVPPDKYQKKIKRIEKDFRKIIRRSKNRFRIEDLSLANKQELENTGKLQMNKAEFITYIRDKTAWQQ